MCAGHLGILLKHRHKLGVSRAGPEILHFLQLPAGAWTGLEKRGLKGLVQLRGDQAGEAREVPPGQPCLEAKGEGTARMWRGRESEGSEVSLSIAGRLSMLGDERGARPHRLAGISCSESSLAEKGREACCTA